MAWSYRCTACLCFVDGDWPLLAKPIEIRGVTVMWPKELERRAEQLGKLGPERSDDIDRPAEQRAPPR